MNYWLCRSDMFNPYNGGFSNYPDYVIAHLELTVIAGLYNEQGKQISTARVNLRNTISFHSINETMRRPLPKGYLGARYSQDSDYHIVDSGRFSINHVIEGDRAGNTVRSRASTLNFNNVNANDISDNLTVKILSINGIEAETAGSTGYIKVSLKQ